MTATIRKIRHGMYLFMLRVMSRFLPGSTHIAFVGSGSSRQLGQHIAALAPRKVLIVTDKALRELAHLGAPSVEPIAVIEGRTDEFGEDFAATGVLCALASGNCH